MSKVNYQDVFLNEVRKNRIPCDIYLTNGFVYPNSRIIGFDNYCVVFTCKLKGQNYVRQYMTYKHAISTISPPANRSINFNEINNDEVSRQTVENQ